MLTLEAAQTLQGIAGVASRISYTIEGFEIAAGVEYYKKLAQGQLGSSAGALYTVPGATVGFIKSMHFMNTGAATTMQLFVGGAAGANAITGSFTLGVNCTLIYEDGGWKVTNSAGYELVGSV